jgi:hypothetical protein
MAASISPPARPIATSARSLVPDDGRGHQTNRHGNRHPGYEEVKLRTHVYQGPILGKAIGAPAIATISSWRQAKKDDDPDQTLNGARTPTYRRERPSDLDA